MRALVIGGTRNVGPDLVASLVARGDSVTLPNRGVTPVTIGPESRAESRATLPPGITRFVADRSDPAALATALGARTFDLVVDTTLYTGPDATAVARLLDGRCARYVFWSTGQVYLVRTGIALPFSDPWMSSLTNDLSKSALGMRYTPVNDYLPRVVAAAMAVPPERVPGYERREEELRLAGQVGS